MSNKTIPIGTIERFLAGERIRQTECDQVVFRKAWKSGALSESRNSTKRGTILSATDRQAFLNFILEEYKVRNLEDLRVLAERIKDENLSRHEMTRLTTAGSKAFDRRVTSFIPINVLKPLEATYEDRRTTFHPTYDAPQHIVYPEKLIVEEDVILVGTENYETIARISDYRTFLGKLVEKKLLFIQRPLGKRDYLKKLLVNNNCQYIHIGDLDWEGMRLYLKGYKSILGERASFFVPENVERFFRLTGIASLNDQQRPLQADELPEPGMKELATMIQKYRKGIEEEWFGKEQTNR